MTGPITAEIQADVRAYAEANMVDAVLITRPSGPPVLNQSTGILAPASATTIYSGKARVHPVSPSGVVGTGEGNIAQRQVTITIPQAAPDAEVDDLVEITAQLDSALVGSYWRVLGASTGGAFAAFASYECSAWDKSSYWSGNG